MRAVEEVKKYRGMKAAELEKELTELRKKAALETMKIRAGKSEDYSVVSKYKKSVARILTIIAQKQAGAENE